MLFEGIFYIVVVTVVAASLTVSYQLSKRFKLAVLREFHRFSVVTFVLLAADMLQIYVDSQFSPSASALLIQRILSLVINLMICIQLYLIPSFIMHLCSFEYKEKWLIFFKRVAITFVVLMIIRELLIDTMPPIIPGLIELALITVSNLKNALVLVISARYARQSPDSLSGKIARAIVILLSLFIFGFLFDSLREGSICETLEIAVIKEYLETQLSIRFYTIFYVIWCGLFLIKGLDVLVNDFPGKRKEMSTSAFKEYNITTREQEVVLLVAQGKTHKHISEQLFISVPTVKRHMQNVYSKVNVNNRWALFRALHIDALNSLVKEKSG